MAAAAAAAAAAVAELVEPEDEDELDAVEEATVCALLTLCRSEMELGTPHSSIKLPQYKAIKIESSPAPHPLLSCIDFHCGMCGGGICLLPAPPGYRIGLPHKFSGQFLIACYTFLTRT